MRAFGRARALGVLLAGSLAILAAMSVAFGADSASAFTTAANCALPGSNFQGGDGNQTTPSLAEEAFCNAAFLPTTLDWQNLAGVTNSPDPQAEDTIFSGSSKELVPGGWKIETHAEGATPGKDNIVSGWSKTDPQPASTFLYLAFERAATTGNTFLTFELNQVKGLWENEQKAMIPCRTTGDILISYNHGGTTVHLVIYRWITDTFTETVISPDPAKHQCAKTGHFEPSEGTPVESPLAQGALNSEEITNYLTDTANPPTPSKFAAGSFGEAAVNLTGAFVNAKLGPCFAFGQMWMSSRSSEAITSSMQDYVGPVAIQTNSCSISGRKFDDANGSGTDDPSKPGLEGWTIQLYDSTGTKLLQSTTTGSGGSYSFTDVAPGSYIIREVGQSGWTCDYPGTLTSCQNSVTLNSSNVNSTGNDFGNKPTSTVTTTQSPSSGVVGTKFGDSAEVSGPATAPEPTGSVEFRLYSDNHCGTLVAGPITETLSAGSASISDASKLTPGAGNYWWVATYGGDTGNASASSGCAAEPIEVEKAKPGITTTASPGVIFGGSLHDTAHLTGGFNPTGTITFTFYAAGDTSCTTALKTVETGVSNGNGDYESPSVTMGVGSYQWVARYSGDANNAAATTSCNDPNEQASVSQHPGITAVKEQQVAGSGAPFTSAALNATVGQQINYRITVTNTGDVPLTLSFSDPHCDAGTTTGPIGTLNPDGTLPPAGVVQYFCSHVLKEGDAPQLVNAVTVTGQPPSGPPVSATSSVTTNVANVAKQVVSPVCSVSEGTIALHGASGSKRTPFTVSISSLGIKQITFYLDGHKLKTLTSAQAKNGKFTIKIDPRKLRYGAHHVTVKTIMNDANCANLARAGVFVHPRPPVVKPKFTG